ncbi:unnamed protein product [Vicia faba]|uniref:Uncharacterized protein n=1 Tax=Vicia faba TaxID=3906 RepID=A0AAV1AAI0_VICFA|nr:unnamed protein product [Vicia faba]
MVNRPLNHNATPKRRSENNTSRCIPQDSGDGEVFEIHTNMYSSEFFLSYSSSISYSIHLLLLHLWCTAILLCTSDDVVIVFADAAKEVEDERRGSSCEDQLQLAFSELVYQMNCSLVITSMLG